MAEFSRIPTQRSHFSESNIRPSCRRIKGKAISPNGRTDHEGPEHLPVTKAAGGQRLQEDRRESRLDNRIDVDVLYNKPRRWHNAAPSTPKLCMVMVGFTRSTITAAAKEVTPHSSDPQPNMSKPG